MAYIGKTPVIGNFQKCDAITVVNGQAAYTMQVGSTNVSPQSENHMIVSLNGIIQSPVDSFTVSGSTITFASNLSTGDVIDFIMILGNVLDLGVPSDNTVSLAKLTATGTKDATTFLRGDNTFNAPPNTGITVADQWRLSANQSVTTTASVLSGWERPDDQESSLDCYGRIGTGMTESSGTFTFPSTGIYLVRVIASSSTSAQSAVYVQIKMSKDGSNYDVIGDATHYIESGFLGYTLSEYFCDVTNTSNDLIQFTGRSSAGTNTVNGSTSQNVTSIAFIRLGDT